MKESVRSLTFLVGAYYFLQAMAGNPGLHNQSLQKFLKDSWHLSPAESAAFLAFLVIPWMLKPLYGIMSDAVPVFGSRRKSYFVLSSMLAALSYAALSWLQDVGPFLISLLFAAAVGVAFSDVLCDAVMVEKGKPLGVTGRLQAAQWFAFGCAGIFISLSKGYIAQYLPFAVSLRFSMLAALSVVVLTVVALKEEPVRVGRQAARETLLGLKGAFRERTLLAAALFIFLYQLSPNLGTALYYYEKDILKFDDVFIGYVDTIGSVGFIIGTLLFGLVAKRLSHRGLLRAIVISGVIANMSYLLFRGALSAIIVTGLANVVYLVAFLGILTIAAKACPKGAEGTVFALLMSLLNVGTQLGSIAGGWLYGHTGYAWLVLASAAFTALTWFLLPLVRQNPVPAEPGA